MRVAYGVAKLGLATLGRLSQGIRVGWRRGFDSGESLDYVYENAPRGSLLVGKLIDRVYLGSPGWRGIRARKANLKELIECDLRLENPDAPLDCDTRSCSDCPTSIDG